MKIHAVESTNLAYVGHAKGETVIAFKGRNGSPVSVYRYPGTTPQVFAAMFRAKSKGKYFAKHYRSLAFTKEV